MWIWLILIPVIVWFWKPALKIFGGIAGFWLKTLLIFAFILAGISAILMLAGVY